MNKLFFLLMFTIIGLAFPITYAQELSVSTIAYGIKELKTIEYDFGYISSCIKNTYCNQSFSFYPTDSVSNVLSSLLRIVAEQSGMSNYNITINGQLCDVNYISTSVGKTQYVADFKCTNIINKQGNYNISVYSTANLDNVHYRAYITYINDPLTCEIGSTQLFELNESVMFTTFVRNYSFVNLSIFNSSNLINYNETWNSTGDPIVKNWSTSEKGQYYAQLTCIDTTGNNFTNYGFTHFHIFPQTFEHVFNETKLIMNDTSNITNQISNLSLNMANNFTNLSLDMNNNFTNTNNLIIGINETVKNEHNYTNQLIENINSSLSSQINNLPYQIWNYANRSLTEFNFLVDLTVNTLDLILNPIYSNFTYTNNLIENINKSINDTLISINSTLPEDIWIYPNRTVINATYVKYVENITNTQNVSVINISDDVLDDIALRVIQYFYALKDKLFTIVLFG